MTGDIDGVVGERVERREELKTGSTATSLKESGCTGEVLGWGGGGESSLS